MIAVCILLQVLHQHFKMMTSLSSCAAVPKNSALAWNASDINYVQNAEKQLQRFTFAPLVRQNLIIF